jgi:hypothetical protein
MVKLKPIRAKKPMCKKTGSYCGYERCPYGQLGGERFSQWLRMVDDCEYLENVILGKNTGRT